uniref:Uncharacterized protein n=1 Tax=Populus alba TaxID=43335 RepID=A0A4U5QZP6_POPAL|nr:hypothetical protein D5086_0000020810 [Populus alba]
MNVYGDAHPTGSLATRNSSKFAVLSPSRHQKKSPPPPPMAETSVSSTAATTPPPLPPWSEEIECILDNSLREMPIIVAKDSNPVQQEESANTSACTLCCLVKNRKLDPIEIIDRFRHDLVVLKGSKRVWNLSKKAKYDPGVGDYLFTPAGVCIE